ncbi:hypothetical protein J6590_073000 [Homalodisca vitripennis]|nr:hypothetical protein J6590_073000 [Homalodisca vitripennis]
MKTVARPAMKTVTHPRSTRLTTCDEYRGSIRDENGGSPAMNTLTRDENGDSPCHENGDSTRDENGDSPAMTRLTTCDENGGSPAMNTVNHHAMKTMAHPQ